MLINLNFIPASYTKIWFSNLIRRIPDPSISKNNEASSFYIDNF